MSPLNRAFALLEGEYIVRVDWRLRNEPAAGELAMLQVQFWTSSGRSSRVYGKEDGGRIYSTHAASGFEICGLDVELRHADGGVQNIAAIQTRRRWIVETEGG
eukprot:COSAG04_NODE_20546_length_391_cov_0.883562_2_plen_102_part_01